MQTSRAPFFVTFSRILASRSFALMFGLGSAGLCTGCPTGGAPLDGSCGNGLLNEDLGESCDDGNTVDGDGCAASCEVEAGFECLGQGTPCYTVCGDGIVSAAEECDEGSDNGRDTCNADCTSAGPCGDGTLAAGEECDDGNAASGDGCADSCRVEVGFVCEGSGVPCRVTACGDGIIAGSELCDEGVNNGPGYGRCNSDCTLGPFCGDGIVQASEECDDGGSLGASSSCGPDCSWNAR